MNLDLLKKNIDTFDCEIDNAYGVIVCVRAMAKNTENEAFGCLSAELYSIEHYLKLLVGIIEKETAAIGRPIDELNIQRFYDYLKRTQELFNENIVDPPVYKDAIFLHKKGICAAFAAYGIVAKMVGEFEKIMEVTS
ncbi:hypothetical protein Q4503_13300 [Colwellia sp. 6_MG-2023]|uniref:hypothetical protein n=1 Tax=Colwellia sp. 6_MG-2023 TaxID=3062676 RepID=UPI0026E1AED9|nr:hypothetical protein [Colwellia sp. 6_MG-2023]MDO6488677.1 hypothetical protein [Colwellia sp. 6_MG-2023]